MANLSAMGITPEVQLAAQVTLAGGEFGRSGLGVSAGLGSFGGPQGGISGNGLRGGSGRSGGRSPGLSDAGGAKKDEEDFDPAVLHDVAGWLRMLRLHEYTPNFEGMTWKEMVVMDEQALEAQGVAGARCAQEDAQDFRGRSQEDGHRRPDRASHAGTAVIRRTCIGGTEFEYGKPGSLDGSGDRLSA
ncbi:hypothetical protein BJY52DRAFT_1227888 [Lactarius psammicola]|nr:hypothetical protein BJY52DRAFT_1227888 [Lactarius psammicola]